MKRGWGKIINLESGRTTSRYHYFQDGMSLCEKYMLEGGDGFLEDKNHYSDKNCKTCAIRRVRFLERFSGRNQPNPKSRLDRR